MSDPNAPMEPERYVLGMSLTDRELAFEVGRDGILRCPEHGLVWPSEAMNFSLGSLLAAVVQHRESRHEVPL